MVFVVKRVETFCFDDLAIMRGVNVFANNVGDQLAHLVAQFAVFLVTKTKSHYGLSKGLTKYI